MTSLPSELTRARHCLSIWLNHFIWYRTWKRVKCTHQPNNANNSTTECVSVIWQHYKTVCDIMIYEPPPPIHYYICMDGWRREINEGGTRGIKKWHLHHRFYKTQSPSFARGVSLHTFASSERSHMIIPTAASVSRWLNRALELGDFLSLLSLGFIRSRSLGVSHHCGSTPIKSQSLDPINLD